MKLKILPTFLICLTVLIVASVGAVIAIQQWSGKQLISDLGGRIIARNLETIKFGFDTFISDQRAQLMSIERHLSRWPSVGNNTAELFQFIKGIVTAEPNISHIVVLDPQLQGIMVRRRRGASEAVFRTIGQEQPVPLKRLISEGHLHTSFPRLGAPVYDRLTDQTVINMSQAVSKAGKIIAYIEVAAAVAPLSAMAEATRGSSDSIVFVLFNEDYVFAHPLLARSPVGLSEESPLPRRDEIGDGVLSVLETALASPLVKPQVLQGASLQNLSWRGDPYLLSRLKLHTKLGDQEITIGTYRRAREALVPLRAFYNSLWFGGGILVLALLAAMVLARSISRPIRRTSAAAKNVGRVEFEKIEPLGSSFIKELHDLSLSFNSMLGGLRLFERYVPRSLVKKLIARGEERIASEERVVTVMFTDIVGFTSLSEGMSASAVAEFTNQHLTMLGECVEAEGGTIDKYIGDSLMAFWGAPDDLKDHAQAACRAAMAIAAEIRADNARRQEQGLAPVRIRVGIHTGPLIVGDIGSPNRINYTIMGDTVNVAARLEALGKEVDPEAEVLILISGETAKGAGRGFDLREEGAHTVRGKTIATSVFKLLTGNG